jgi:hypothetical protein
MKVEQLVILAIIFLSVSAFLPNPAHATASGPKRSRITRIFNAYDDYRSNGVPKVTFLSEENVIECLEVFIDSDYGKSMFGCHPLPSCHGVTGEISFVDSEGPEVVLALEGAFWHRRSTVLGRAAMWLNACMPEITEVRVRDASDLEDYDIERNE